MQSFTRLVTRPATRLQAQVQRQQKRLASHGGDYTPQTPAKGPASESFGAGFFISLIGIPAAIAVYTLSRPSKDGEQPYFSRLITTLSEDFAKKNEERNSLHTAAIEQAAADRTLFLNSSGQGGRYIEVRFPEQVNGGSPYNVPAGHGTANMDFLIEKYQKQAYEDNEKRHQQVRDNKVPVEQPLKLSMPKNTPAAADS